LKKILSTVIGAMLAVAFLFSMTGCGSTVDTSKMVTANADDSQMTITALEKAQVIKLKKAMFNLGGDYWTVTADDKEVAIIKGQAFKLIGDTYSMYSTAGNFVGAEGEQLRLLHHSAQMYDLNGNKSGVIKEQFNFPLTSFEFTDAAGKKIGKMDQDFALTTSGTAKDTNGADAWSFSKSFFSLGAELTMTRKSQSKIPAMTAIWTAVIMNEISESSSSDSSSSTSTSKK
jgi:uncharacterized protein YxjI